MKDNHVWNISKPPVPGWYHATATKNNSLYRWWDGKCWSEFATKKHNAYEAGEIAASKWDCAPRTVYWREIEK
jgi:hypothetical protein